VALVGCSSNVGVTEGVGLLPSASTSEVNADYDDIDAAVAVAAGKNEMAVLWSNQRSESPRRFYLKTVRDEPVYLFIGRQPSFEPPRPSQRNQTGAKPPEDLVMRCTVGRWGDDRREEDLLDAIEDRLDELRGKDAAPIRR
jgi:hypothetical protein